MNEQKKLLTLLKEIDGEVHSMYALLGEKDLLFIVNCPDIEEAIKASVALNKLTPISFATSPAVTSAESDKMIAQG